MEQFIQIGIKVLNEDKNFVSFTTKFCVFGSSAIEDLHDELVGRVLLFHFSEFGSFFDVFEAFLKL